MDEIVAADGVKLITPLTMPNTWAWYAMVSKFKPELRQAWPKGKAPAGAASSKPAGKEEKKDAPKEKKPDQRGQKAANKKSEKAKKEQSKPKAAVTPEDDEFDPFAEDPEADAAAAASIKAKEEAAKDKKKKAAPIAKSIILWEIKPWGEETDLDALAAKILAITMDGLVWKTEYKKEPVAYGIFKLIMGAVVEDDKVSTDTV